VPITCRWPRCAADAIAARGGGLTGCHRPAPERPPARDHVPARIRQLLRGVGNLLAADCACRAATLGMPTVAAQAQRLVNGSAMASAEPLTPTSWWRRG
jgi:hypothetical protein